MKQFLFETADNDRVEVAADIIGSNAGDNATVMEVRIKPAAGQTASAINTFQRSHPVLTNIKQLVSSKQALIDIATTGEYKLTDIDTGTVLVDFPEEE